MGFYTVAIGRGSDKEPLAENWGAQVYLDSATDAAAELKKLGGAKLILATAPGRGGTSSIAAGLARNGKLLAVGFSPQAISISVVQIVGARQNTQGWPSGSAIDSKDILWRGRPKDMTGCRAGKHASGWS